MPALLVLEDGTRFAGESFGADNVLAAGLAVPCAASAGLPEWLTDPAAEGLLPCLCYPHAGNAGLSEEDFQSASARASGLVALECGRLASNWRQQENLDAFMRRFGLPGLKGADTRRLARHLARRGRMKAALGTGRHAGDAGALLAAVRQAAPVGTPAPATGATPRGQAWAKTPPAFVGAPPADPESLSAAAGRAAASGAPVRLAILDLGAKRGLLRLLAGAGFEVTVWPAQATAAKIAQGDPAAVVVSPGPGEPGQWPAQVETVRSLLGQFPVWGIGLGGGLVALASGLVCRPLLHARMGGLSARRLADGRCGQVSALRLFAVDEAGLRDAGWTAAFREVDECPEKGGLLGLERPRAAGRPPARITLFNPEGAPGPDDFADLAGEWKSQLSIGD